MKWTLERYMKTMIRNAVKKGTKLSQRKLKKMAREKGYKFADKKFAEQFHNLAGTTPKPKYVHPPTIRKGHLKRFPFSYIIKVTYKTTDDDIVTETVAIVKSKRIKSKKEEELIKKEAEEMIKENQSEHYHTVEQIIRSDIVGVEEQASLSNLGGLL